MIALGCLMAMETLNDLFFGASIDIKEGYRVNISLFSFFHKVIFSQMILAK